MGLPTRNLDDRTFQDIVDEAKKRIAASCPAWTDHNVSDPGITLVELFAWMTEMILYRLNQVPAKNYRRLMELLGLKLQEPEPARCEVTFYLSAPQPQPVVIRQGTEVATVRAEGQPSVVFSTDQGLEIQPPRLIALAVGSGGRVGGEHALRTQNLQHLGVAGFELEAFGAQPRAGDALYLGFANDLSHHVVGLDLTCPIATGLGIDPAAPPWRWEVSGGEEGSGEWRPAAVESDSTGGMNQSGTVLLRLPRMGLRELAGQRGYWLRCQVVEPAVEGRGYDKSPRIHNLAVRSWGGSVMATHASVVSGEVLGRSDGSPGQRFQLEHAPLLRRANGEVVEVRTQGETEWEPWVEVPDFSGSGPLDRHFTCDSASGEVCFGPALRLPDGSVRSYGAIPPRGALVRFSRYRYGGGVIGNVQAGTLTVLKTSIPYVDRVTNHKGATGGLDAESIEAAEMRAPQLLRSQGRAVTAGDYEALATMADSRVQRARCVQPLAADGRDEPLAGRIYLLLVPRVSQPAGRIAAEDLKLPGDLVDAVRRYLDGYRLLTVRLDIREPEYIIVSVQVTVAARPDSDPERVRAEVEQRLYGFLNPIVGGAGQGWPFGRALYPSDLYACLQGVPGIEFIEALRIFQVHPSGDRTEVTGRLDVPVHGLIASGEHRVAVKLQER